MTAAKTAFVAYLTAALGAGALALGAVDEPPFPASCRVERLAYAPADNLEAIDVALIGQARRRIDFAAYVLTNIRVVEALDAAAARGVAVRLYRDGADQPMPRALAAPYDRLAARMNVEIRYKAEPAPFMHLKAYAIDGELLREGAGNFSHSGLTRQDNSLIALRCKPAVTRFETAFETMWRR
ncbi:phospholipase D-like domain-containing protein [Methylocystis sp. WRRC1]|uniref:phospholipase D-like domain-containing protein n=1 Tax=unclassified Methylocystis TaxID=2625913 RepID=UPI0001F8684F|nr:MULTISPECIES: phospholipase D-like domain-containing protein [unclassified Methylocystis]MCC3246167.1 phospholipase D-like domain-containing protein [Methylocystis sp. WRRC1]